MNKQQTKDTEEHSDTEDRIREITHSEQEEGGSGGEESTCSAGDSGSIPGSGRSLGKEMAAHSSIPAWRIPQTEEPGGLQSMGLHRVGTTEQQTHTYKETEGYK